MTAPFCFPLAGADVELPNNDPKACDPFVQRTSGLSADEIDWIRAYGDALEATSVKLYGRHDESHVRARGSHFPLGEETRWLYERMAGLALAINAEAYRYDLSCFAENFYYLRYEAGEHFNWHVDMGPLTPAPRKLSLTLSLSDPSEYDGGDFDVLIVRDHLRAKNCWKGVVTAFPSWRIHRVTPVTRGVRRCLVAFAAGPLFR